MKDPNKNPEINSEIGTEIKEKKKDHITDIKNLKKDVNRGNALLHYLPIFEKSPLFETINIKKGDLLFNEGMIDTHLYIIKKGLLSVEKYTTSAKKETKQLATLKTGDFLGEGSLNDASMTKEALIIALENSEILAIDSKNNIKKFIEENPSIGYELLKYIIVDTNKRLLESNKIITTNYEIDKSIKALTIIDTKNIFILIDKIKLIADVDYILYLEKHQIMENFFTLKYDSRQPSKMQDMIFEKKGYFLDLNELFEKTNICTDDLFIINKLNIGSEVYGYLIFGREKRSFSGSDKKVFTSISNSFAGVLKKFITDKENKNKLYLTEMKNK